MFLRQVDEAIEKGIDLCGVCAYSLIDRPDWNDGHLTNSGLWDFRGGDPGLVRVPQEETIAIISEYSRRHTDS